MTHGKVKTMKIWLDGYKRCCDRETAVELGGEAYLDTDKHTLTYFDEYITIIDEVCHDDTEDKTSVSQ